MYNTTYVGNRGSGKTYQLFKDAEKALDEGKNIIFLCPTKNHCNMKKEYAQRCIGKKANQIKFLILDDLKGTGLQRDENVRFFIDDIGYFVNSMIFGLGKMRGFTAAADVEDTYITLYRSDWDKNYIEGDN